MSHSICFCVDCFFSSFQWYLDNVYPEMFVPSKALHKGSLRSAVDGQCLTVPKGKKKDMLHQPVFVTPCKKFPNPSWNVQFWHFSGLNQRIQIKSIEFIFILEVGEIRHDDVCVHWRKGSLSPNLLSCNGKLGNQSWIYNKKYDSDIYSQMCLKIYLSEHTS